MTRALDLILERAEGTDKHWDTASQHGVEAGWHLMEANAAHKQGNTVKHQEHLAAYKAHTAAARAHEFTAHHSMRKGVGAAHEASDTAKRATEKANHGWRKRN